MRLGIFGGTFDPPHVGHLLAASDAIEALSLDRLVLVPAARQPLKTGVDVTPPAHRLEMTRLLADGDPRLTVDPIEIERDGLSFTVDTVAEYARRHPGDERWLLLGEDAVALFPKWREPERVASLARIAVLARGEGGAETAEAGRAIPATWLRTRRVDVSATEVRERVRRGLSIRGFVTEAVAGYIERHRLYRQGIA